MMIVEPPMPGRLRVPGEMLGALGAAVAAPQAVEALHAVDALHAAVAAQPGDAVRILRVLIPGADAEGADAEGVTEAHISIGARTALALGPAPGEAPRGLPLAPMVLMIDAPGAARSIAEELAGCIVRSGLFYESHLADFAEGTRARSALADEPQARFGEGHRLELFSRPEDAPALASRQERDAASTPVPAPLEPLVREQLASLERNEVRFAIPIGQQSPAELVIGREESGEHGSLEGTWTTRLRLELPNLGEVHARIRLSGRAVSLEVDAVNAPAAERLGLAGRTLRDRLSALDLQVTRLEVQSNA